MDDSRGYFRLGLFVLITAGMLVACVIALGANLFTRVETVPVETLIDESVAGLEPGSAVKYRGVTIGQVSRITFADTKYAAAFPHAGGDPQAILVEMSLDPQKFKPLTVDQLRRMLAGMVARGLRAQLSQSLLSGVTVVEINYVDPKYYPPPKLSYAPTELFIPSTPSPMKEVVGGLEKLVRQLTASDLPGLVHRIDHLVGDVDQGVGDLQIATMRAKAVALVDEVRGTNRQVSELLASPELKQTIADLPRISGELRQSSARINELLHDRRIEPMMSGLASTASNAGPAAADLRRILQELRELVASQNDNIRIIINNLRDLTSDGRTAMDDLKKNPSRLILGSPPPRNNPGEHP